MNKVILTGNLVKDIELKYTESNKAVLQNTIAVKNDFKNANGEYESQFINIEVWNKTAEFLSNYFHKGSPVIISGRIQTGSYDKDDGTKVYTTDVIVEEINFSYGDKEPNNNSAASENKLKEANVEFSTASVPAMDDDSLPF